MKIGDNIKEIRENEKSIKKEDIAIILGITTKAYNNIENNVTDITLHRLDQIAEIFNCTPEYILNYKKDYPVYPNGYNHQEYSGNNQLYSAEKEDRLLQLQLYEQLLASERSRVTLLLERALNNRKH